MNINSVSNNTYKYPNFRALKVAETSNTLRRVTTNIDLYKIGAEDKEFLFNLLKKIKYTVLYPKIGEEKAERWQQIFNYSVDRAFNRDNTTYIAIHDNKPCGIMTFEENSVMLLDGICTIPTEVNNKVPGVGKTLFYQLFKDTKEADAKGIVLVAVLDGPFDVVKKYEALGFLQDIPSEVEDYSSMTCNKYKVLEQLKKLSAQIEYNKCNEEKVNLNQFLD